MRSEHPGLVIEPADYLYFVGRAIRGMAAIVTDLGDDRASTRPDLPGANTPYGLLTHCLGVVEYWGGHLVAGREVSRDREAEFDATGSVTVLSAHAEEVLRQLDRDLLTLDPRAPLRHEPEPWALGPDRPLTQSAALVHLYEEVAQHHGQMQVLRDALTANHPADQPTGRSAEGGAVRGRGDEDGRHPTGRPVNHRAEAQSAGRADGGRAIGDGFEELSLGWLRAKRGVKWHRPGPDVLPAWVADMDLPLAPAVRGAIDAALDRGDLGYPDWPGNPLAEPFADRMRSRYGWSPDVEHVRGVTDLLQALQIVISLTTDPGQGVVAHTPNYPPFLATIERMDRRLIAAPVLPYGASSWTWDHDRLEADLRDANAKVLLLVSPHNPTGHVFGRDELERIADLAERHDLIVVCDEIHAELTHHPHTHVPFASLGPEVAARTVTITSATKAFNIAGLRTAVAHVGPARLRRDWDAQPPDLYGAINVLGVEATRAAWAYGDDWLTRLNAHLLRQRDLLTGRVIAMPKVAIRPPEAGYLAWLDLTEANLPEDPAAWLRRTAGVELSPGPDFGPGNEHRARLNFATSQNILVEILDRMDTALTRKT